MLHAALVLTLVGFQQADPFDFSKVSRDLVSEPKYLGAPRYALVLFGGDDRFRMWMVLDESKPGAKQYAVLYVDLDGDGRLGEEGERYGIKDGYADRWVFEPGPVAIEGLDQKIDRFRVSYYWGEDDPHVFFAFRVNGKVRLQGGSRRDLKFGESRAAAPILRAHPFGPLTLRLNSPEYLRSGGHGVIVLNAGIPGSLPGAFLTVDERFLDLEKGKLTVDLVGRNADDKEVKATFRLKNYC